MAEKGNNLKQRDGESENDYITRLKDRELELRLNKGKPRFASDIEDLEERKKWVVRQHEQWTERHEILKILVKKGELEKDDYITHLKSHLRDLFEQHIAENEDLPLFASDIEDLEKRKEWLARQLEQWEARHDILKKLIKLDDREKQEIINDDHLNYEAKYLELRQRWLTEEGRGFLERILWNLQEEENRWDPNRPEKEQTGLDFAEVTIPDGKKFADFYYVHEIRDDREKAEKFKDSSYVHKLRDDRDLRWADLHQREELRRANLQGTVLRNANFQGADLSNANLQGADLKHAKLQEARLKQAELQGADLCWANLQGQGTYLWDANLQGAFFQGANLQGTYLGNAKLQGAWLLNAELQGADFNGAVIAGPALRRVDPQTGDAEREIDDRSANFAEVKFSREWRGPKYIPPMSIIAWLIHLGKKKLAWRKWEGKKEEKREIKMKEYPEAKRWYSGRPTTFFGVDTSRMDASKNPGLKRYIEDEQYIEDFKEKHRVIYWFWAMSSDCGRCLSLWAFWSIVLAGIFAVIYWLLPSLVFVSKPLDQYQNFPLNLLVKFYFSVVTFTTLGFGDLRAATWVGTIVVGTEVVLGYFFLGGLVAILASKLARRA